MGLTSDVHFVQRNINGYLKNRSEWNQQVAQDLAKRERVTLTDKHWDIIHYLRTEFYSNGGLVPLHRDIKIAMGKLWKREVTDQDLVTLFPGGPNEQAAKIAGCVLMNTVEDLLIIKGDAVWSVKPDQPVRDALTLMADKNIGAVMVIENCKLIGLVSERDFTRDVVGGREKLAVEKSVGELMTKKVVSVSLDNTLDHCMEIMTEKGFRHLPVLDQSRVVGMLSMTDLVRIVVEQQQFTISQLKNQANIGEMNQLHA